jgi:hypothetical protein
MFLLFYVVVLMMTAVAFAVRFVKTCFDKTCFDVAPAQPTYDGRTHSDAASDHGDLSKMKW